MVVSGQGDAEGASAGDPHRIPRACYLGDELAALSAEHGRLACSIPLSHEADCESGPHAERGSLKRKSTDEVPGGRHDTLQERC